MSHTLGMGGAWMLLADYEGVNYFRLLSVTGVFIFMTVLALFDDIWNLGEDS